jgi:hypothetical protein
MRRQFRLPPDDELHLDSTGFPWETVVDANIRWLLVHDRPVPAGYTSERVRTALLVPAGYPDVQIDMVYFEPALARRDGGAIGALASQVIEGRPWQRWSRHRSAQNPWRPGVDDVAAHLILVDHWLRRELGAEVTP